MPKNSFVDILRRRLRRSPPVFTALLRFLDSTEEYLDWVRIVRELLPEREAEILAGTTVPEQIQLFCRYFEDRYFPLLDSPLFYEEEVTYSDFLRCIPVHVDGWEYETYHDIDNFRPGMQMMIFFFENPFEDDEGAHVALAEMCAEHVSRDLLEMVPRGGFKWDAIGSLLAESPYRPLYEWGLYMRQDTGNFFQDTDEEYLWSGYGAIEWDRETIEALTREWQQSEEMNRRFASFAEWLEDDPTKHFQEILHYLQKGGEVDDSGT